MFYILMLKFLLTSPYILPDNVTETSFHDEINDNSSNLEEISTVIYEQTSTILVEVKNETNVKPNNTANSKFDWLYDAYEFTSTPAVTENDPDVNVNNEALDVNKDSDENVIINKKDFEENNTIEDSDNKCKNICMSKSCINTGDIFM
jgi:hypothetical protein